MTTTKELREALQSTEPAFPGVEVAALRYRAHRIRRRNRIAGAAVGVAVATAAVTIPHLPGWTAHRRGAADIALGGGYGVALANEALAQISAATKPEPITSRVFVWLRPSTLSGASAPSFCEGDAGGNASRCQLLERTPDGLVGWTIIKDQQRRYIVAVTEKAVTDAVVRLPHGTGPASVRPLAAGYSIAIAGVEASDAAVTMTVELLRDRNVVAHWLGTLARRDDPGRISMPAQRPEPVTGVPGTASALWIDTRAGAPRACLAPGDGSQAANCALLADSADGVAYAFGLTSTDGKRDVESVITRESISGASAKANGVASVVSIARITGEYTLITASFAIGAQPTQLDFAAYDSAHRQTVHFSIGTG
jgi:hypothetical protein